MKGIWVYLCVPRVIQEGKNYIKISIEPVDCRTRLTRGGSQRQISILE